MSRKIDIANEKLAAISTNLEEINSDVQTLLDQVNATPGDGLTGAETDLVISALENLATRTRATADMVPAVTPPTP